LTGVTEPIEFTFMFLAPFLYVVHALLTGVAFIIMNALQVRLGFGFSAGLFDYVLNFNRATRPWLLFPVGALYFGLYYGLFRFSIVKLNLKTPGRDAAGTAAPTTVPTSPGERAVGYIAALGGAGNIVSVDACTTRLRLVVGSQDVVDTEALKSLGARGVVRPSATSLQVVIGANADQVAGEIRDALRAGASAPGGAAGTGSSSSSLAAPNVPGAVQNALSLGRAAPNASVAASSISAPSNTHADTPTSSEPPNAGAIQTLLAALGGRTNIRSVDVAASRLRIGVVKASIVDATAIRSLGLRGLAIPSSECVHLIVGPAATATSVSLRQLIA
jgi:PTS system N-acetylglucosamine-specific IIC component